MLTNLLSVLTILFETNTVAIVSTNLVPVITESHVLSISYRLATNHGVLYQTSWVARPGQVRIMPPPPLPPEPPASKQPPTPQFSWLKSPGYTGALERIMVTNGPTRFTVIKHTDSPHPKTFGSIGGPRRTSKAALVLPPGSGPYAYDSYKDTCDQAPYYATFFVSFWTNIQSGTLKLQVSTNPPPHAVWQTIIEQAWRNEPGSTWGVALPANTTTKYERMILAPQ